MANRCALYARVSTEEQAEKFGLATQFTELRDQAGRKGYLCQPEWEFVDDGYSGADLDRPALGRLREVARQGEVDIVLVYDPDRLARKLAHQILLAEEFEKARVRLEFVTTPTDDTPEGRMFFNLKGVFAEYEKEKIRERTLRGRRQKARQGFIVGGRTPHGYRYLGKAEGEPGRYVVHEEEARVVRLIFHWFVEEGSSIRGIVTRLNQLGYRPQRGIRWGKSSVHRILSSSTYAGRTYYNRRERTVPLRPRSKDPHRRNKKTALRSRPPAEWIPISVPAIIDTAVFERAQAQLRRNQELLSGRNTRYFYLLKGLLRCGACGRKFIGLPSHGTRYYRCQGRDRLYGPDRCRVSLLQADRIETFVWETVVGILKDPALLFEKLIRHHRALEAEAVDVQSEVAYLEQSLREIERQEARALEAYLDEALRLPLLKTKLEDLAERKATISRDLERARERLATHRVQEGREQAIRRYCRLALRGIGELDPEARRRLLRAVIDEILLNGRELEIRGILPGRRAPEGPEKPKGDKKLRNALNRPQLQYVVAAGRGDLQGPFCVGLTAHLGEVHLIRRGADLKRRRIGPQGLAGPLPAQKLDGLRKRVERDHIYPLHHRRLGGVDRGEEQTGHSFPAASQGDGKHSPHRADGTVQGEFPQKQVACEPIRFDGPGGGQDADSDGEIEAGAFLSEVGGGQVHGDALHREDKTAVADGGADPIATLSDRGVGEPNGGKGGEAGGHVHLHRDERCLDPLNGRRSHPGQHAQLGQPSTVKACLR